jgi:predicted  nucleic acid-binding Zn-ribbon protein
MASGSDGRDRPGGRMGDATRQRIDELKDGWKLPEGEEKPAAAKPAKVAEGSGQPARPKRPSRPPPPPPPPAKAKPVIPESPDTEPMERPLSVSDVLDGITVDEPADDAGALDDEPRADATRLQPPTDKPRGPVAPGQQVRKPAALPRKRGLVGDVRYVFTALAGVTSARKELAEVQAHIDDEHGERDLRLLALAKQVVADATTHAPWVDDARDLLGRIEEARSQRAGAAAAAEAEIDSIKRSHDDEATTRSEALGKAEKELAQLTSRLEPLERQAAAARKKATALHATLAELDKKITATKGKLVSVKGPRTDPQSIEAELAALRAEREGVAREEPEIAAELDDVEPKVASLQAARTEAEKRIASLRREAEDTRVRTEEKLTAIRARKAVEDRGVADADRDRDGALRELGERVAVERPDAFATRLRPIDTHDAAIATLERRALELSELVGGIDRGALFRGIAMLALATLAVVGLLVWLLFLR